jgi:uncharacterized protein involved in outer membrane biogenesis
MAFLNKKYLLSGLTVLVAALITIVIGASYFLNTARPRLEQAASSRFGITVSIHSLSFSILPPAISAKEVEIGKNDGKIARIAKVKIHFDFPSLVRRQVSIPQVDLEGSEFFVTRSANGAWNIEALEGQRAGAGENRSFLLPDINIRNSSLILTAGEKSLDMQDIDLSVRKLAVAGDERSLASRISVTGDFHCRELRSAKRIIRDLTFQLQGREGRFSLDPLTFQALDGTARGKVEMDLRGKDPAVGMHLELQRFRAGKLFTLLSEDELLQGEADLIADLTAKGGNRQALQRSLSGMFVITGRDLVIPSLDLDKLLEEYVQSQRFNLVDLGAFAILGPLGTALTTGYDFSGVLLASRGGSTDVGQLVSRWEIDKGVVIARDVALATPKNRIAVSGSIDLVDERFRDLEVAVVEANGCAVVSQKIDGPFDKPRVEKPSFIATAAGPILNLLKGTARIITGGKCKIFYNGSVSAPGK